MKMNPITALCDLFSKFIIEHGSAVVQGKHIALLKEQFTIIEKKSTLLETENTALKAENETLKNENVNLKNKIQTYEKLAHNFLLDKCQTAILLSLSRQQTSIQTKHIAQSINIGTQITKFHLEELKKRKLVKHSRGLRGTNRGNDIWSLAHEGRRYLIQHEIIS